jgi:hypothetical protein
LLIILLNFPLGEIDDGPNNIANYMASLPYPDSAARPFRRRGRNNFGHRLPEAGYADGLLSFPDAFEHCQAGSFELGNGNLFHGATLAKTVV